MPDTYDHEVFISYSSADRPWAIKLYDALEEKGMKPFLDQQRLDIGKPWDPALAKAVQTSQHCIVLWSGHAEKSSWVRRELGLFENIVDPTTGGSNTEGRRFLFVMLEGEPPAYASMQMINDLKNATVYPGGTETLDPVCWCEVVKKLTDAIRGIDPLTKAAQATAEQRVRIFISYKRNVDPDEQVALQVFKALNKQHDVFIDQTMQIGTRWAERIEAELQKTDFLITFLSAHSVHSEMVEAEIETAHRLGKEHAVPAILPVRLAYREPFQYPLSAYLNPINWAFWEGPEKTSQLIAELLRAVSGDNLSVRDEHEKTTLLQASKPIPLPQPLPSAQPLALETPEEIIDPQSIFYIERSSDRHAIEAIKRQGATITIKGPRQMGKSSLLIRTKEAAIRSKKLAVFLDFQLFDSTTLQNADTFFRQFSSLITDELQLEDKTADYWKGQFGPSQTCTRYMSRYLLKEIRDPLVLAMDEVDRVFAASFRSDFFGMLRSWHNNRASTPLWKRLDLVLVTSTDPYLFIQGYQSPFNVGETIELSDFTDEQVANLNTLHGSPLNHRQTHDLVSLLGGHPYLVRRALYLICMQSISLTDLMAQAADDQGPFGDHLRNLLFRLRKTADLIPSLRQVLEHKVCRDTDHCFRLRSAGLIRMEKDTALPRCQLYAEYLRERLYE